MSHLRTARSTLVIAGVAAATVLFTPLGEAVAKPKKSRRRPAVVAYVEAPKGPAGTRGSGAEVGIAFALVDRSRRPTDIEVQWGWDVDGVDGIEDDEFFPATENEFDSRNTRSNRKRTYSTAANVGAAQSFVWSSKLDVGARNFPTLAIQYTPQGRVVEDPDHPGEPLFKDVQPGVKVRIRAVTGQGARSSKGEWIESDSFPLNNNDIPSMTIDGVLPNTTSTPTASDEHIAIKWTVFDPNSEDANANGVLDILEGEDTNLDGQPDFEKVAVAFDYHEVLEGEDPANMSPEELAALSWLPATRAAGEGDPDDGVDSSPAGRQYTFVWDSVTDVGTVHRKYVLRARPFDSQEEHGEYAYFKTPFTVDNWKIFNHAGEGDLLGPRSGASATNLTTGLSRSDPARPAPFQTFLVAGGANESGVATNELTVMLVSTESGDTSNARPLRLTLQQPRAWHSATMLDDGRVLIAGGVDVNGNPLKSTEIYDPFTRLVTPGPDLLVARSHHTAVRLTSGDVVFFGGKGTGGAALDAVEAYNFTPVGSTAVANTAYPSLTRAQYGAHALLMPDQRVLVTGGLDGTGAAVQTAELLNPLHDDDLNTPTTKNPRFEPAGNGMLAARRFGSATALLDGNVLFAGGAGADNNAISSLEVFNASTNRFEPVDVTMPDGARAAHVAPLLGDGTVLLAGGTTVVGQIASPVVASADVFRLTTRDAGGTWSGEFLPVNGDMLVPRRNATAAVVNNGRAFVVGGVTASGVPTGKTELYTPENGVNGRPVARLVLQSSKQSWAFGAPLLYRVTDPERDPVRVVMQWSQDSGATWEAASPQAQTLGGDVAELTANLASAASDNGGPIDPAQNVGDHTYIWSMKSDIERPIQNGLPLPGGGISDGTKSPFNLRAIPFGAVQGDLSVSTPVTVLFNTKVLATVWPLEDSDGTPNPNQGGDITIYAHLRDVDGNLPMSNGDTASLQFQYAVDLNGDGAILASSNEFWANMTPAGFPVGANAPTNSNPQTNLFTYYEAPEDSDPTTRLPGNGWTSFIWDSVFDLGAPKAAFDGRVQIRAIPSDLDEGFAGLLRNTANPVATNFNLVKHPDSLFLRSFTPRGGNKASVKVNEPVDFVFNGLVDPATVNTTSLRIYRNASLVLGAFVVTQNQPQAGQTTVTFFPQAQSRNQNETLVYGQDDPSTVLFPFAEYRFHIPGYIPGNDPRLGTTLRLDNGGFANGVTSTYLLVQGVTNDGDSDPQYRFTTSSGHFDDGQNPAIDPSIPQSPAANNVLANTQGFTVNLTKAVDHTTVGAPNLNVHITDSNQVDSVVPGYWRVANTIDPVTGQSRSSLTFVPHFKMPSGATVRVSSTSGLLGENGRSIADASTSSGYLDFNYSVTPYGRNTNATITETFSNQNQEDTSIGDETVRSAWGTDPCAPNAITGLQGGSATPVGGPDVTVANGQVYRITQTTSDFGNITVQKGGTLSIEASASPTIRLTGNLIVEGLITFKGADGYSGHHGNQTSSTYYYYSYTRSGTRRGGEGKNGGGSGGDSITGDNNSGRYEGLDGTGNTNAQAGQGGNVSSASTSYSYGAGGGSGGGHGTAGFNGGRATSYTSSSSYGPQSIRGAEYGDPNFSSGVTTGAGGGGGGSHRYSSIYYNQGGAGGAGGGGVTFIINGILDLRSTGMIDGRGGHGGGKKHLGGAGGGGAGGGLYIVAGVRAVLDGVIDLRGGRGGPAMLGYYGDYYSYYQAYANGTARFGGDGGLGRCRIEAGNLASVDEVRVFGQLMTQKINSVPTTNISGSTAPSNWSSTGTYTLPTSADIRYTSGLTIPSNVVVNLAGTTAKRIWVDGDINIDGNLRLNGGEATSVSNTLNSYPTTVKSTSSLYYTDYVHYQNTGSLTTAPNIKGFTGVLGGGAGGDPVGNTNNYKKESKDGIGPSPGKKQAIANGGYVSGSYRYMMGQAGGGGGGNATAGTEGWAPYSASGYYSYLGDTTATDGSGILPQNGGKGGAELDPRNISHTSIANFVGSGGAGGSSGGFTYIYNSWNYFGLAGRGGAGGGGVAFITPGNINVRGRIEARGGRGNPPGAAYPYYYAHSAGGAGSGGTVMLIGANVTINPVTGTTEGSSPSGATIDLIGGYGGGWRDPTTGNPNQYPSYNTFGQFGGDGGYGRLVVQYSNSFNNGQAVLNRWGMSQSTDVFHDGTRQYRALSGSLTYKCYGAPRGGRFRSKWYDLQSINPVVNGLSISAQRMNLTLLGEGAQSHPRNPGASGIGEADPNNTSGLRTIGSGSLVGWRWFRFDGSFTRTSSTGTPPVADDAVIRYETDQ